MRRTYCTYFDSGYLTRGMALIESLQAHAPGFQLWVLCFDTQCYEALSTLALDGVVPVPLAAVEEWDPEFAETRGNRSRVEYYFTASPVWPLYIFDRNPDLQQVTYLDGDLYFFASPEPIYAELGDASVGIIPHRYGEELEHLAQFGIYNVGFLPFRRDESGLACLAWWRERCLEWCYDRSEPDRFADQKYLDRWPELFDGVHEIRHNGANLAPWNLSRYQLSRRDGAVFVDRDPLVFFHVHGLKRRAPGVFDPQLERYGVAPSRFLRRHVYQPYLQALSRAERLIGRELTNGSSLKMGSRREPLRATTWRDGISEARQIVRRLRQGAYFLYLNRHVL